ncbi:MAG: NADH:ubiquinone reductase (Na(+)-transporting) subunit C [Bacteroidales bacterium]
MSTKNFTNRYIFIYITLLVLLVAILLSLAAIFLQPKQQANHEIEKMQQILKAAGYSHIPKEEVQAQFQQVVEECSIDAKRKIVSRYQNGKFILGTVRPFDINLTTELYKATKGEKDYQLPFYIIHINNNDSCFVIPLSGKGLWGPIWGYMAIGHDCNTVKGCVFAHKGETPGLGAEISTDHFASTFNGKLLYDTNGNFVSVKVVKGGVMNSKVASEHGVDAITGGTITSKGVEEMISHCLSFYLPTQQIAHH